MSAGAALVGEAYESWRAMAVLPGLALPAPVAPWSRAAWSATTARPGHLITSVSRSTWARQCGYG
eukprot:7678231-Alexandrium_andersonii.AAC.1